MGPKVGQKPKKKKFLITCSSSKNSNLPKNFETLCSSAWYYLWCKFQQDRTIFGEVRAQKTPKMAQFMDALLPRNFFKIYNLRTTNAIKMKLDTTVYLHETFYLTKDLGVADRLWEGVAKKLSKKSQKIGFLAPFFEFSYLHQKP